MELIAVVMGCDTSANRFAACKSMLDYGFANFALVNPKVKGELEIPVKLGTQRSVIAVPGEDAQLLIDKSQKDMVTTDFTLEESVTAPVSRGQRLGTMTVRAGEQILMEIPMVAETGVSRITWGELFLKLLGRLAMAKQ
jgi:D-alanyl-D-alanine carboxypeptidase (penicillin-binding protein 5/6)